MNNKDIERAIYFATTKHLGQTRRDTVMPYIIHPLEVMKCLYDSGITEIDLLIAGVLHDILEDTKTEESEIENGWGNVVLKYVKDVTKTNIDDESIEQKMEVLKLFDSGTKCVGSCLLKIVDRYCNVMDFKRNDKREWFYGYYALQAYPLLNWFYKNIDNIQIKYGRRTSFYFEDKVDVISTIIDRMYGHEVTRVIFNQGEYRADDEEVLKVLKLKGNFFKK